VLKPGALAGAFALAGCASTGDPPGGPPDEVPPAIVAIDPDSGAVLDAPPRAISIDFSEVISERAAGQRPDISYAVVLSPVTGDVRVTWHRRRLLVRPREGFRSGVVYRLEVLPLISDLRQNRMRSGVTSVFSTGPGIPAAVLSGAIVDWTAGRPATNGLIEAVLLPDSLPYRIPADSQGLFRAAMMPPGEYLVYGVLDTDNNRRRGTREAYDTLRVHLDSSASLELYAFVRDTAAPRLRQVELVDSLTLRLSFDRPLDPLEAIDTAAVLIAPEEDTTAYHAVAGVFTPRQLELRRQREDSLREAARRAADTTAADPARAGDTPAPARPAPAAPLRAMRPAPLPAQPPRPAPGAGAGGRADQRAGQQPPRDSTLAMRMLARRPPPSDSRLVLLAEPLEPERRYVILIARVRSLNGVEGPVRSQLRVPAPRAPVARPDTAAPAARPAQPDSAPPDSSGERAWRG
jgi:hypothetical protein